MPYFGADAMVQAGRVAVIPGHLGLILVTAYSVSAEKMDPAHWEGSRASDRRCAAGDGQGARSVLQPGLAAACAVSELCTPAQGLRRAMLCPSGSVCSRPIFIPCPAPWVIKLYHPTPTCL